MKNELHITPEEKQDIENCINYEYTIDENHEIVRIEHEDLQRDTEDGTN